MSDKIPLLFADDDYMITDPMKRILQRHGFLVRTADTARRAIDIVMDGFNPDVSAPGAVYACAPG